MMTQNVFSDDSNKEASKEGQTNPQTKIFTTFAKPHTFAQHYKVFGADVFLKRAIHSAAF